MAHERMTSERGEAQGRHVAGVNGKSHRLTSIGMRVSDGIEVVPRHAPSKISPTLVFGGLFSPHPN